MADAPKRLCGTAQTGLRKAQNWLKPQVEWPKMGRWGVGPVLFWWGSGGHSTRSHKATKFTILFKYGWSQNKISQKTNSKNKIPDSKFQNSVDQPKISKNTDFWKPENKRQWWARRLGGGDLTQAELAMDLDRQKWTRQNTLSDFNKKYRVVMPIKRGWILGGHQKNPKK